MTERKNFVQQGFALTQSTVSSEFSGFIYQEVLKDVSLLECLNFWEALYRSDRTLDTISAIIHNRIPYRDSELLTLWEMHQKWQKENAVEDIKRLLDAIIFESRLRLKLRLTDEKNYDQQQNIMVHYLKMKHGELHITICKEKEIDNLNRIIEDGRMLYKELMNVYMMLVHKVCLDEYRINKITYTWLSAAHVHQIHADLHMEMIQEEGCYRIRFRGKYFILHQIKKLIGSMPSRHPADPGERSLLKVQLAQWFIPLSATFKTIGLTADDHSNFYENFLPFAQKVSQHASEIQLIRLK